MLQTIKLQNVKYKIYIYLLDYKRVVVIIKPEAGYACYDICAITKLFQ